MADDGRVYSARDVQAVAGLSYRQINDWDNRGSLPHARDNEGGWRRFSARDIFVLMVVSEIRHRFGVPVNMLDWLRDFMLQEGADHLQAAAKLMAMLGVGVWLITDLEEIFIVDSELEVMDRARHGFFGGDHGAGYVMLKLNPLVNELLGSLSEPIHLPAHSRGYDILHQIRERFGVRSAGEFKVLQAIRSGDFKRVEIKLENGEIRTIRTTTPQPKDVRLSDLLGEEDYQRITVVRRDGEVVAIDQEITERITPFDTRTRLEREAPIDAS